MTAKKRKPFIERLRTGLKESIAHERGKLTLRTVEIPDEPPLIDGPTLVALRKRAAMSQAIFARILNVSTKTLQSWEQGLRRPSDSARRLLQVFSEHPELLCRMVGLALIPLPAVITHEDANGRRRVVVAAGNERQKAM